MSDLYGPFCSVIEQTLDLLDEHAGRVPLDREGEAIQALRVELRAQVVAVRAAEPGAVKRLHSLLHLLIEAEFRHLERKFS